MAITEAKIENAATKLLEAFGAAGLNLNPAQQAAVKVKLKEALSGLFKNPNILETDFF
jgi:hypothetical protein